MQLCLSEIVFEAGCVCPGKWKRCLGSDSLQVTVKASIILAHEMSKVCLTVAPVGTMS